MMKVLTPLPGLELLVSGLFDYSGTFPPASKSFCDALRESAGFARSLRRPQMQASHLVIEHTRIDELLSSDLLPLGFFPKSEMTLCVLTPAEPNTIIEAVDRLTNALRTDGIRFSVRSVEMKVGSEAALNEEELTAKLSGLRAATTMNGVLIAVEPDLSEAHWEAVLASSVRVISGTRDTALKCRCTGPTGIDVPRLAAAIASTCDERLPFKVTGGLHHPVVEPARYQNVFGFLNLTAAIMLRRGLGKEFSPVSISDLLMNDSVDTLQLSDGLAFRHHSLSLGSLREMKDIAPFSIGSCSLSEPDDDLERLFD